ncbi:hypothetical protein FsymDg_2438 [Candidatus Protofrankia datiscae]|uniref:Uncharacterized protein n=1 Tax=Candidatus Protofrankia datiscae TaxID=2716812 RepID=F8B1E4_9ACTN|nr:hypothetical protein FsymDg_2438 [Candidatus Protofrankia datiscae]
MSPPERQKGNSMRFYRRFLNTRNGSQKNPTVFRENLSGNNREKFSWRPPVVSRAVRPGLLDTPWPPARPGRSVT